ncbi:hypothetical protein WIW50_05020 [Flavobacteriaceae bacterium 3-367]|uniref:hypothetical protein n=1 Tax=Eudoraea algarum TaxID=3417568 RepID=UPI003289F34C
MNKKIRNIVYLTLGLIIAYSVLAIPISNNLSNKYDVELNRKRIEYGLKPITESWKLDSIVLQSPVRGMNGFPSEIIDTTSYRFLENKWYCQYWSNKKVDKTKPYHKSKKICFTKSFWVWQNRMDFEYNTFINPNADFADYEALETTTHWNMNGETYGHHAHMKDGEDLLVNFDVNQSMLGFEKEKIDKILKKWNLK